MNYFQGLTHLSYASFPAGFIYLFRFHSIPTHHHLQSQGWGQGDGLRAPHPTTPRCVKSGTSLQLVRSYQTQEITDAPHQPFSYQRARKRGGKVALMNDCSRTVLFKIIQQVLHRPALASHSKEPICFWWLQKWFCSSAKLWAHHNISNSLKLETSLRGRPSMSCTTNSKVGDYYDRECKKSLSL